MIANTAGVILAGGKSSRFGSNKALAMVAGKPMISHAIAVLESLFSEHLIVTNAPEEYGFTGWNSTMDIYPGAGPLAGIHAALSWVQSDKIFVVGCDMPFIQQDLIEFICSKKDNYDVVIPQTQKGVEPLHALYHKNCLAKIQTDLQSKQRRLHLFLDHVNTRIIPWEDIAKLDPQQTSFRNINHQSDLQEKA